MTFLGQKQQLPLGVLHYFVRAHCLTKGGNAQQPVVLVVVLQTFVKVDFKHRQFGKGGFVVVVRLIYRIENCLSVAEVVPFQPLAEVENRAQVVKSNDHFACKRFACGNVVVTVEARNVFFVVFDVVVVYRAALDKSVPVAFRKEIRLFCRHVPVAPVRGKTVARV